ncbi:MAG: ABC transporter permease [Phycisphaerae bacterium]|nr:ABC transporter permease [Phycisphaerae bacterium]
MSEPRLSSGTSRLPRELQQVLGLLVALVVIYALMVGLSAIDVGESFWKPGAWRLRAPILLIDRQGDVDWTNQRNILEQGAINVVLGVGMTLVILAGEIDLSVGSVLTLCNVLFVVGASPRDGAGSVAVGVALALGAGLAVGLLNGVLTARFQVPSFVVTLGMLMAAAGAAHLVTIGVSDGQPMFHMCYAPTKHVIPLLSALGIVAIAWVILGKTRFGRHVYAVGGSAEAARLSGISVVGVKIGVFAFCGMAAALAGIVKWSRVSSGTHVVEEPYELYAIAAAVIGGTSLMGGRGNVIGTFIGALIIAVLIKGLNTLGVHESVQKIIIGAVIIAAVLYDRRRSKTYS